MAYITSQEVAQIRKTLKARFPNLKLSVTRRNHSTVDVDILAGDLHFTKPYEQINHYYLDKYENAETLQIITDICMKGNHDNSDSQSDYFDVGWYFSLSVGRWDKPYVQNLIEA